MDMLPAIAELRATLAHTYGIAWLALVAGCALAAFRR